MIFNFFLGNHRAGGLKGMVDLVLPIYHGLAELGHRVIKYGLAMETAPAVNLLLEFFPDDDFTDKLLAMKAEAGDRFRFGLICTEDPEDALVMEDPTWPRRRTNFLRVLPAADFVWTLLPPVEFYESIVGKGKVALLEYGFSERFLTRPLRTARDLDFLMYGNETPYRKPIVQGLEQRGFKGFVTERQSFPDFITTDMVSRSKLVLDLRRGPGVRYPSPTRICKALHSGTLVMAEHLGQSAIANLYDYTVACSYNELLDKCGGVIRSGLAASLGQAAALKFKAETSMRRNMERVLSLPVFQTWGDAARSR